MGLLTKAQTSAFLSKFTEANAEPAERLVVFEPAGGELLVRGFTFSRRVALRASGIGRDPSTAAAHILAMCVFMLDHVTNEQIPFADADAWERIANVPGNELACTRLLNVALDLGIATSEDAEKKSDSPPTSHSP